MQHVTQSLKALPRENPEYEYITTTLYELIEAINEVQPVEEAMIENIVLDLAERGKITFI